ncbi:MAG: DUF1353 domain-containing protein [Burkholderiaceae bacterium]|nr:DUF1353 domain-containing protein [Burkholderiaceae bacterium]
MRIVVAVLIAFFMSCASAQNFGSFVGSVVAKWNPDGKTMTLVRPFAYIDPSGSRWEAPKGAIIDGASIPKFAWSIIGGPLEGKYRDSSVIHDVACNQKLRSWKDVHQAFYTGMLASGVSIVKAKIMYAAVYHFGPRWPTKRTIHQVTNQISENKSCVNMDIDNPICITIPKTSQPMEAVINIDIPPPIQKLSHEKFYQLQKEIEDNESGDSPISLEQIREYK